MSELEKKFYNWLMLNYCVPIKPEKIAHDFAGIAEKHYRNEIEYFKEIDNRTKFITKSIKENAELKKQNELMNCTINEMGYEIECHKKQIEDNK